MKNDENDLKYTKRLALTEELKAYPWNDVYDYYCYKNNVPVGMNWLEEVEKYEKEILSERK